MKLLNPDFLAIGLDNGRLFGWTLSTNTFDNIEAHPGSAIMCIKTHGDFLLTGDRSGNIQVRNMKDNFKLATKEIQSMGKNFKENKQINTMLVVQLKGEFIVYAGNNEGVVQATKVIDQNTHIQSDFSAFRDQKAKIS
jgi:hypothetical protein